MTSSGGVGGMMEVGWVAPCESSVRSCAGAGSAPHPKKARRRYSQEASFVPGMTKVASRSGPVEIMPISTPSSSEMNFR